MSGSVSISSRDQKALSYFRHFAAVDLSGYLPGRFWDQLVLQVSSCEPVVQQTLVAVSNAHSDHCARSAVSSNTLSSHQKAIRKLHQYIDSTTRPSYEIVLICCILMFAFARMTADQGAASVHFRSAMSILRNARRNVGDVSGRQSTTGSDALHTICVMLIQLDIESMMQDANEAPQLDLTQDIVGGTFTERNWNLALKDSSPHEAMEPWMAVAHDMWRFIVNYAEYRHLPLDHVPAHVVAARRSIQFRIRDWRRATRDYIRDSPIIVDLDLGNISRFTHTTREIVDVINALIIEAHYFASKRFIAESLQDPQNHKPFDWKPEKLLKTAQRVLALRKVYHARINVQPSATFSTHVGIVEALLLLSHRTSFPHIRAQVQTLVQQLFEAQGGLTGLEAFYAGYGAPPLDFVLIYEKPGH